MLLLVCSLIYKTAQTGELDLFPVGRGCGRETLPAPSPLSRASPPRAGRTASAAYACRQPSAAAPQNPHRLSCHRAVSQAAAADKSAGARADCLPRSGHSGIPTRSGRAAPIGRSGSQTGSRGSQSYRSDGRGRAPCCKTPLAWPASLSASGAHPAVSRWGAVSAGHPQGFHPVYIH